MIDSTVRQCDASARDGVFDPSLSKHLTVVEGITQSAQQQCVWLLKTSLPFTLSLPVASFLSNPNSHPVRTRVGEEMVVKYDEQKQVIADAVLEAIAIALSTFHPLTSSTWQVSAT